MSVVKISGGVVVQSWKDVADLAELTSKYGLSGAEYVAGDAAPGTSWADDEFTPPAASAPVSVPALKLMRALQRTSLDVTDSDNPVFHDWQSGETRCWPAVRAAMWAATWNGESNGREEWEKTIEVPRDGVAFGYFDAGVRDMITDQGEADAFLDFIFTKALTV